jgi:hypothetical protein
MPFQTPPKIKEILKFFFFLYDKYDKARPGMGRVRWTEKNFLEKLKNHWKNHWEKFKNQFSQFKKEKSITTTCPIG